MKNSFLLFFCSFFYSFTLFAQTTYYVNHTAAGANTGASWSDAFEHLQDALASAVAGDEIWVAEGTYYPDLINYGNSFYIPYEVKIYGGFPNNTTATMSDRDPVLYTTVLSGDLGVTGDNSDNTGNVVIVEKSTANNVLDGFTIDAGNRYFCFKCPYLNSIRGTALHIGKVVGGPNISASNDIRIINCIFKNNNSTVPLAVISAIHDWSTVYVGSYDNEVANPVFENCTFFNNSTSKCYEGENNDGGLISTFKNCTFYDNAIAIYQKGRTTVSLPTGTYKGMQLILEGCKFENNIRTVVAKESIDVRATDCVVMNNLVPGSTQIQLQANVALGAAFDFSTSSSQPLFASIDNCTFYNNYGIDAGALKINASSTGTITANVDNCIFWSNHASVTAANNNDFYATGNTNLTVTNSILSSNACSPAATCGNNVIFSTAPGFVNAAGGDLSLNTSSFAKDKGDNAGVDPGNTTDFAGNPRIAYGTVDMGAFECLDTTPCPTIIYVKNDLDSLIDSRDGEVYQIVSIGNQTWMAENLRYNASGSFINTNNPSTNYGRLYNWSTLMNGESTSSSNPSGVKGLCPNGWHLPSDAEWNELEMLLGMSVAGTSTFGWRGTDHGTKMKSIAGWNNNGNGTNSSGFNVLPTGYYISGSYVGLGNNTYFWSSTESTYMNIPNISLIRVLNKYNINVGRSDINNIHGLSCRCVKDISANNGLDWANAFTDLQDALALARAPGSCVEKIYVAEGTYHPTTGTDRTINYELVNDVEIYGGFPNTGNPVFADRDVDLYETILSGDIGVQGVDNDNSFVVVSAGANINLNNGTILDGFSIKEGHGGLYIKGNIGSFCELQVESCSFFDGALLQDPVTGLNSSIGIGIFTSTENNLINPKFSNCFFKNTNWGSASAVFINHLQSLNSSSTTPYFFNCDFNNNSTDLMGASSSVLGNVQADFEACTFRYNQRLPGFPNNNINGAGGIYSMNEGKFSNITQTINLTNCLFHDNVNLETNNQSNGSSSAAITIYSGGLNSSVDYNINNCTFSKNTSLNQGSTLRSFTLNSNSSININMNNSIIWNNGIVFNSISIVHLDGIGNNTLNFTNSLIESFNCMNQASLFTGAGNNNINCISGNLFNFNPNFINPVAGNFTLSQSPASPGIDAGSNTLVPTGITQDIAGNTRIFNSTVDMGCYENFSGMQLRPVMNVTATAERLFTTVGPSNSTLTAHVSGGTAPYTYAWSTGDVTANITVSPTQTTTYSLVITDAAGNTVEDFITITVEDISCVRNNGRPGVLICNSGNQTLCVQPHVAANMVAAGNASYGPCNIIPANTSADPSSFFGFFGLFSQPGPQNRMRNDDNTVSQTIPTFIVYPNPAEDKIQLMIQDIDYQIMELFDNMGRKINEWNNQINSINVAELPQGIYHLRLTSGEEVYQSKFVKK